MAAATPSLEVDTSMAEDADGGSEMQSASSYTHLPYLFGNQDPAATVSKPKAPRRKTAPGGDQVKHRRTRSGCYTCRMRRVKCDEAHPICNRCRKAGRVCEYTQSATTRAPIEPAPSAAATGLHQGADWDSDDSEDHHGEKSRLQSIPDENEETLPPTSKATSPTHNASLSTSQGASPRSDLEGQGVSSHGSPARHAGEDGSSGFTASNRGYGGPHGDTEGLRSDWSHLPSDLQFYLWYFYDNITCYHYSMKSDPNNFWKTYFIDAALRNDALLNAVVGFSAYRYLLQRKAGKIHEFLQYYNKAVSLLLKALQAGERHNATTILTMLQLATIEEYLGDWVNLVGHQKAAYKILTELYTPDTIMQKPITRSVLHWYTRFDIIAGLLAGTDTVLSRAWPASAKSFYQYHATQEPYEVKWKIEVLFADIRLIAMDMSNNFAQIGRGQLTFEKFLSENADVGRRLKEYKANMDPMLSDVTHRIDDFSGCPPRDPDSLFDPYVPGVLYRDPLWAVNLANIDYCGVNLMYRFQTAVITRQAVDAADGQQAYGICQMLEAVDTWPESPRGSILAMHTSLALAALYLPRDERHGMWVRRKLAKAENEGYIFPPSFRKKFAELFRDPSCLRWWLPDDESYSPIMQVIRGFVDERSSTSTKDDSSDKLRDMGAVFSVLKLDDSEPAGG